VESRIFEGGETSGSGSMNSPIFPFFLFYRVESRGGEQSWRQRKATTKLAASASLTARRARQTTGSNAQRAADGWNRQDISMAIVK